MPPGDSPEDPQAPASGLKPVPRSEFASHPVEVSKSRLLVVVEPGFDGRQVEAILRHECREVMMDATNDQVVQRLQAEEFDAVIVCSHQSGGRVMELLDRITLGHPGLPVIVVTGQSPSTAGGPPPPPGSSTPAPKIDSDRLLRSVREALTEPKIKRLIRLTNRDGLPQFVARNARWISEDLQSRYSLPFHWTPPGSAVALRFAETA